MRARWLFWVMRFLVFLKPVEVACRAAPFFLVSNPVSNITPCNTTSTAVVPEVLQCTISYFSSLDSSPTSLFVAAGCISGVNLHHRYLHTKENRKGEKKGAGERGRNGPGALEEGKNCSININVALDYVDYDVGSVFPADISRWVCILPCAER